MRQEEADIVIPLGRHRWNLARLLLENVEDMGIFRLDLTPPWFWFGAGIGIFILGQGAVSHAK